MSLGTKVLSARVPFEFYVKLLEEAQRCNMTISDYVMIKINKDNLENISITEDLKAKIEELELEIQQTKESHKNIYNDRKLARRQVENQKAEIEKMELIIKRLQKDNDILYNDNKQLLQKVQILKEQIRR